MARRIHFNNIDVLRGYAILSVVIFHCVQSMGLTENRVANYTSIGAFGVDLFFVISGFLITDILIKTVNNRDYFKNFYGRRILRIFPLYYGFLLLFIFILPHFFHKLGDLYDGVLLYKYQVWYWLYIPNTALGLHPEKIVFPHLWSLAVEEQYYMIWPLFVWLFSFRNLKAILITVIILSFSLRCYFVVHEYDPYFLWTFTPIRLEAIAIGSLLSICYNENNVIYYEWRKLFTAIIIVLVTALLVFVYTKRFFEYALSIQSVGILLMDILFGCVLIKSISSGEYKKTFFNKMLKNIGKFSYSIYIFHMLVLTEVLIAIKKIELKYNTKFSNGVKGASILCATLAFSYIIAFATWNLYEKHFIKLKRYFNYKNFPV
jgi:peptidoglycan/LPS O-acetylase OafA/YrhL